MRLFCLVFAAYVMTTINSVRAAELKDALPTPYPAPAIAGIAHWINSEPLTPKNLKGKVVLIDFWAYSCVNCVRTLPYLREWDKQYRDKGLVIIGVHAPEFEFEKSLDNVKHAVEKWKVTYPVALDNDMVTWSNFNNRYWPAHYLINKQGNVVYTHFGEGKYDVTEHNIRTLLGLGEKEAHQTQSQSSNNSQTPETYLGYARMQQFENKEAIMRGKPSIYRFPATLNQHGWALDGTWTFDAQKITSGQKGASLRLNFTSLKVFLVLGSAIGKPVHATVTLAGKPPKGSVGKDAPEGKLLVDKPILYELIAQPTHSNNLLEIKADDAGLEAYAFTFGQ